MVVRDYSRLPDVTKKSPYNFTSLALENGLAVVYTVSSKDFSELFFYDDGPAILDEIIFDVIEEHEIPKENIFIGGISSSGTRALRYAQYCEEGKSKNGIKINGVFAVDSPLDSERFYYSATKNQSALKKGMLSEAKMMETYFPDRLGGTPEEVYQNYVNASVYTFSHKSGGNAHWYKNLSLLFFHEPDIDRWLTERGATYYDINSFDIVGFTSVLKSMGNENVELITSSGKGYNRSGERNCHSWTIVDENYLVNWLLSKLN